MTRIKFRWFHANLCSNPVMAERKVIHDALILRRLGRNGGFNEIKPRNYKRIVAKVFGSMHNLGSESPQTVNPHIFRPIRAYRVRTHGGFLRMTPVREISVLLTETVKGHIPVAFIESHYLNKGKHKPLAIRKPEFRDKLHLRHFLKEQTVVNKLREAGFTIFGGEDVNKLYMPRYNDRQVWVHDDGIDKMWYVEGPNVKVTIIRKDVVKDTHTFLYTDHPALTATVLLELLDA